MVEPISALIMGGVTAAAVVVAVLRRHRARLRAWRAAVQRMGLSDVEEAGGRLPGRIVLTGRSGELAIRLDTFRRGKYAVGTRIVIDGLGPAVAGLSLRGESLGSRLFGRDVETGDPEFDRRMYVEGPALLAQSLLTAPLRERAARLLGGEVAGGGKETIPVAAKLEQGVLEVRLLERDSDRAGERLSRVLKSSLALARRLAEPAHEDPAERLADNLPHEPEAGVRLQALLALHREAPRHPATRRALLAGLRDRNELVRLRAAMALGEEGHETLRDLVESIGTEDEVAAAAIRALGDRLPPGKVKTILERVLPTGRRQTARACIARLDRSGHAGAQRLLIQALRSDDVTVAAAAARALGRVGTVAAVGPQRAPAAAVLPSPLRSAARQAIVEVQARIAGAGPGQLTLAAGEAGALSLAAGTAGALSLAGEAGAARVSEDGEDHAPLPGDGPDRTGDGWGDEAGGLPAGRPGLREG